MKNISEILSKMEGMVCITGNDIPNWVEYINTNRPIFYLPECGRNINKQAEFVSSIKEKHPNAVVITYSAFIVSDFEREQVLFIKDDEIKNPEFETFGASSNKINMCLFGRRETCGDYAMEALNRMRKRLDDGELPDSLINEIARTFGDSIEKTLLMKMMIDRLD